MVLIKGLNMPQNCADCGFTYHSLIDGSECCSASQYNGDVIPENGKLENCPLISLDDVIAQLKKKKLSMEVGDYEGNNDVYNFNCGIDACIAILRGLEGNNGTMA